VSCLAYVYPRIVYDVMVHPIQVAFVLVTMRTSPLDLWDDMVFRNIRDCGICTGGGLETWRIRS